MKSSEYYAERSELRMKRMHDKATDCMIRVNKSYDDGIERLNKEIDRIMGSIDGKSQAEIQQHLLNTISYDKYKELLQIYHTTKDKRVKSEARRIIKENAAAYRVQRKEALIRAIEIEKLRQVDTLLNLGGKHLKDVYSSVTFELDGTTVSDKYSNEVLNHNWAGSNFSKRVWKNQEALSNKIQSSLLESFSSGKSNKQIATELSELTNYGRNTANRLIRTETSYMVNSADLESSKRRGIKAKKFEAHLDSRTSRICRKHNQIVIPIDKIKIGENAPPLHPYCRSFLSDLLEDWDYETEEELEKLISDSEKENVKTLKRYSDEITTGNIHKHFKANADVEQFLRYKETIRPDKFNLTFEEFDKIKYNKGEEYENLKLDYKVTKCIKKNDKIADKARAIDLYYDFKEKDLVASDHFIEQFIMREFDRKGNRKFDFNEIVALSKLKSNYVDVRNGRPVILKDKISIIKENDRLVTIRYGKGSKHWKQI